MSKVRIGSRVISLEPAPVEADQGPSGDADSGLRMSKGSIKKNASQLVDLASDLLKTGVEFGIQLGVQSGAKTRKAIKSQANSLVTGATHRVKKAVQKGSRFARKRLKKL